MTLASKAEAPPKIGHFTYGSNLDPGTFLGRRQVRPNQTVVARLDGWAAYFNLPVGPGERGVGNVRLEASTCVWGSANQLNHEEANRLDRTKGVGQGSCQRVTIQLEVPERNERLGAFTYQSTRGVEGRKPSRRYLGLLLTGARHHMLPPNYIEQLRMSPLAIDERETQLELPL